MEEILDCLKLIVNRWVETSTPITVNVNPGDTIINVTSTRRFRSGDEVMLDDGVEGEPNLIIDEILDFTHIKLATPVFNTWTTSQNTIFRKLTNSMFVEGVYIGKNNVIPMYLAIEINGTNITSEFMTLGSYKDRYEIELTIMVEAATTEDGYRFLLRTTDQVIHGLKRNFYPLVNNYDTSAITGDVNPQDEVIRVADSTIFNTGLTDTSQPYPWLSDARAILENQWQAQETRVQKILSPNEVLIAPAACHLFRVSDNSIIIRPRRFIFNSWPHATDVGTLSKDGTLLQTSIVRWFAEEEVPYDFNNDDPHLK